MSSVMTADEHAQGMQDYVQQGVQRAGGLGNRGPARFDADGQLDAAILEAFWQHGFYVFEGLVQPDEIALLQHEFQRLIEGAPVDNGAPLNAQGAPALGSDFMRSPYSMIRPLSDPWGGTELLQGRHPMQMSQPRPQDDAPRKVVFLIGGMCQLSDAALRLYGHPDLLGIAASINGSDFVPFNDATFVKQPGLGGSVAWHQDGVTHWQSPNWDEGIHGFNFQVQLYPCTAENCLWVMPGSHKSGKIDIKGLVAENDGSEYLPGAVPLLCQPGDVTIVNRQALHCSFANTSPNQRVSVTFGFHRYSSVLGQSGALAQGEAEQYDAERITRRAAVVAYASAVRGEFYAGEEPFRYAAFADVPEEFVPSPESWQRYIKDYYLYDLSI